MRLLLRFLKTLHATVKRGGRNVALPRPAFLVVSRLLRPGLTDALRRLLAPGQVVIDVGANIGYYTALAAELVGEEGRVLALEPDPAHFARLARTVEANCRGNVTIRQMAAAARRGTVGLYRSEENSSDHTVYPVAGRQAITVEAIDLDALVDREGLSRVDLVKLDVQGFELEVLAGMRGIVAANPELRLVTEFWPVGLQRAGFSPAAYLDQLAELGFGFFPIEERCSTTRLAGRDEVLGMAADRGELDLLLAREPAAEDR